VEQKDLKIPQCETKSVFRIWFLRLIEVKFDNLAGLNLSKDGLLTNRNFTEYKIVAVKSEVLVKFGEGSTHS
jgi:hypothetical protein